MLTKIAIVLALVTMAALAMSLLGESGDEATLAREVEGQLDALREHLFRR
jgi:hypothetical protein